MYITSLQNDRIKALRTLKTKKGREETGTYLLEGKRSVSDALHNGVHFACIILQDNCAEKYSELLQDTDCQDILQVSPQIIESLSDTSAPEGIMAQAIIEPSMELNFAELSGLVILLDRLQDPGNLGTIIRTADASGVSAILVSRDSVELHNAKTVRATMGSIFNLPIYTDMQLNEVIPQLKAVGYTVCGTGMLGENIFTQQFIQDEKIALIIGNEGNGIAEEILALADRVLTLPMKGKAESLNAAIAAGILMYQVTFNNQKGS